MRVNLIMRAKESSAAKGTLPVSLTIRPACGLPGDYEYDTDFVEVLRMLSRQTDLPETVLTRFTESLSSCATAQLLGVELNEKTLTEIGYFID
jgi:hypothetical protein